MAAAIDVAEYILSQHGEMSAMKLHRLVYYSQGWHLAWEGHPLFEDEIQAWANGPVIPALYELHRGSFTLKAGDLYAARNAAARARAAESAPDRRPVLAVAAVLAAGFLFLLRRRISRRRKLSIRKR